MDTDKIVTTDGGSNFANGALMGANLKNSGSDFLTALLAGGGGMNNWANNPFIYLVWMMFAQNMWGGNGQGGTQAQIQAQGQQLQSLISAALTQLGFAIERNASASQATSTSNTQRIIDTLTNHWNLEQQTTIQQLRDEVGRLNQSNQLIAALKGTATATSATSAS